MAEITKLNVYVFLFSSNAELKPALSNNEKMQLIVLYIYVYIFLEFEYSSTKKEHFQNNSEAEKAGDFIRQMFLEKVDKGRTIYTHYTCANGKHITLIKYPLSSRL